MRHFCISTLLPVVVACACAAAHAQSYPTHPVTIVSPLPAGASPDVATRAWMNCAEKLAGQPFVLLNKPGANGVVAAAAMRQAPADGYTILLGGMSQTTITPFIFKKQPYDPEKEYQGAAMFGTSPLTMVASAQSGIKSVEDLVAYSKTHNGGVDIGIPAVASPAHLLSAAVASKLGIQSTLVPLAGEAGGITSLLAGQVPVMVFLTGSAAQYIESGKFVPIMNFTEKRLAAMPNVPTAVEALNDPTFVRTAWIGMTTKVGSPPEVVRNVDAWTKSCLQTPEFTQALKNAYFTPQYVSSKEYPEIVRRDIAFWRPWIAKLGISNE